ncbi:MAG: hypothetical protein LBD27_06065 [Tannerella sp.]|jgi:hypothetical protein|nr:hypothetical protein [Tannerella sp.]
MGFLENQTQAAMQQWAENLTLEQIEEYERKGADMTEYREQYYEREAARIKDEQEHKNSLAFEKLNPFKKAHSAEDAFVTDVVKFNCLPDKEKASLELAPLAYGMVVQAYWDLFKPGEKDKDHRGIVFLFALDDAHRYNEEWLAKTANRISEMKEISNEPLEGLLGTLNNMFDLESKMFISGMIESQRVKTLPEDCRELILQLRNDRSSFCFKLGETLSEGADAWCATYTLYRASQLPNSRIPYNRIVPFLLSRPPVNNKTPNILLIPPEYYTK